MATDHRANDQRAPDHHAAEAERYGTGEHEAPRKRPVAAGKGRDAVFKIWFVVTAAMLAGAWGLGRVLEPDRIGFVFSAVAFPILTAALLLLGLAWLVWMVFFKPR